MQSMGLPTKPIHMTITGQAGSGKSETFKAFSWFSWQHGLSEHVAAVSYTWRAAKQFSTPAHAGLSTHSFFGIPVSGEARGGGTSGRGSTSKLQEGMHDIWFICIDEVYVCTLQHFHDMHTAGVTVHVTLANGQEVPYESASFGGVSTVRYGDPRQHTGIGGLALYASVSMVAPEPAPGATLQRSEKSLFKAASGMRAWRDTTHVFCLQAQHRLRTFTPGGALLDRHSQLFACPPSKVTFEVMRAFLMDLQARVVSDLSVFAHLDPHVIVLRNKARWAFNWRMSLLRAAELGKRVIIWYSVDRMVPSGKPLDSALASALL